jgi:hypothetical protein
MTFDIGALSGDSPLAEWRDGIRGNVRVNRQGELPARYEAAD